MADTDTTAVISSMLMDRATPLGNSLDVFNRRSLHVKVGNSNLEPIPVTVTSGTGTTINEFSEISSVPSGTPTVIQTYTVPVGKTLSLQLIETTGDNIATYDVTTNALGQIARCRTYFGGGLNKEITFGTGFTIASGDIITVTVTHSRPDLGNFESRIFGVLS